MTQKITSIVKPLSSIPEVKELEKIGIKELNKLNLIKLEETLKTAETKIQNIHKFINKLKVMPEPEKKKPKKKNKKKQ